MKTCRLCDETLPLDSFYIARRGEQWWYRSECKRCHNASTVRYARARRYGLTVDELDELIQDAVCAICKVPVSDRDLHIDHSHDTGIVRDVLCGLCNCGLGFFREEPTLLRAASTYLRRHKRKAS